MSIAIPKEGAVTGFDAPYAQGKRAFVIATQCFYPDVGGIENLMTALADACHQAGHRVTVFADRVRDEALIAASEKPYEVRRFGGPRPWRRWRKSREIAAYLKRNGGLLSGVFACSWKSVEAVPPDLSVPITALAHGMEYASRLSSAKGHRIEAALKRCAAVAASSHFTADAVRPFLANQPQKLRIIHPPVAPLPPPSEEAGQIVRDMVQGRGPVLVTVARLEARKGIDKVIQALPDLIQQYPNLAYLVVGQGDDRDRLAAQSHQLGVSGHVVFAGRVSNDVKAAVLNAADLFAMPVRQEGASVEGFGVAFVEAAFAGIPSVAGSAGGASDAVLHGETGFVCDGTRQPEVTRCLLDLLADESLRSRFGEAARRRAHVKFSWAKSLDDYLSCFEQRQAVTQDMMRKGS